MKKLLNFIAGKFEAAQSRLHAFVQKQDQIYYRAPAAYKKKMDWFFFWSVWFFGSVSILAVWGASLWMN